MNWGEIIGALLPFLLNIAAKLIPSLAGVVGGPWGWILSLALSFGIKFLTRVADKGFKLGAIKRDILDKVHAMETTADSFFDIQDKIKAGDPTVTEEQRKKAQDAFEDAANNLIKRHKPA